MYLLVRAHLYQSSWAGAITVRAFTCAQWPFEAAEKFKGPFFGIKTSHLVVFASELYDPITPLSGAFEASENFVESRVLEHKGQGLSITCD